MKIATLVRLAQEWWQYQSSKRVKKDPNIWVFGAIRGRRYFDNAKYLFEYVNTKTPIRAIWISKEESVVQSIRNKGYEAYIEDSSEARHYAERAQVAVITHRGNRANADIPFQWLSPDTFLVQLWHGIPLKKIAFDDTHFSYRHDEESLWWRVKDQMKRWFFPFRQFVNYPNLIPASSDETRALYASAFRVPLERVAITGYPRNDRLASANRAESASGHIIYMPTFRGEEQSDFDLFTQYGFDHSAIDQFLSDHGLRLHIKLHPFNYPSAQLLNDILKSQNISLLDCDDIYEVLHNYQLLITDYSSIYFDYLLLNRPIVFAPFDKSSYLGNEREFYFNYDEVTPGPKANNWPEVFEMVEEALDRPGQYAEQRRMIADRFTTVTDGNNCERLYAEIKSRLGNALS